MKKYLSKYGSSAPHPPLQAPLSKSWLFEIANSKTGNVIESFTLVLPPTHLTIKEPQRVALTPTFGNVFIDDYGMDNLQITIRGFSGTSTVFPTFKSGGSHSISTVTMLSDDATRTAERASVGFSGRDAFYEFRDSILRYKDHKGWEDNELRVYDLSDEQAYRCVLLDFTLERTSEHALRYPFTINLVAYERFERMSPKIKRIKISGDPISNLNKSESILVKLKKLYNDVARISNNVTLIRAKVLELKANYTKFLSQTVRIATSPLDLAKTLIESGFDALRTVEDTYRAGKMTLDRYAYAKESFHETLNNGLKVYGYQITEGWNLSKIVTYPLHTGLVSDPDDDLPPEPDSIPEGFEYRGLKQYMVKGGDTLQSIALNELGDESLWPFIPLENPNILTNKDLIVGMYIFIPVVHAPDDRSDKDSNIFSEETNRDPYGTDIAVDDDGDIIIHENGNVALVSGIDNIIQAINLRLNTLIGSVIKQSAYGIAVQAGIPGSGMAIRYLKLSVKAAVMQDPRIAEVTNMQINMDRDTIYISMDILPVGYDSTIPVSARI